MSIESAIARVSVIEAALRNPALAVQGALGTSGEAAESSTEISQTGGISAGTQAAPRASSAQATSFATALQQELTSNSSSEESSASNPAAALLGELQSVQSQGASASYGALDGSYGALEGAYGVSGIGPAAAVPPPAGFTNPNVGAEIVRIAETQAGQHEEPMGSNEGAAVAMYRSATREAIPGAPWCAYFASWVARQAGVPLGSEGQGLGSVGEIWEWAQSRGRAIPNGPGVVPKQGDLIVFGSEHVGIVRGVLPNGKIATIEGNYENQVALNERSPSEPTGYVEL